MFEMFEDVCMLRLEATFGGEASAKTWTALAGSASCLAALPCLRFSCFACKRLRETHLLPPFQSPPPFLTLLSTAENIAIPLSAA